MFKILILGEPEEALEYVTRAFQDLGEYKETYNEWYKEINALDDICDLEIDVITNLIDAEFDEIIPMVDGIIYFLNPLNVEQFELFDMYFSIIQGISRDIPTIIMYYDSSGIIPIPLNVLFEYVWYNYPNLEVFANPPPIEFHQVLECLCLAMIAGDTPLNIENAWMRFPILIELANSYFEEENYFNAAQTVKKAATITEIYNNNEFFIHSEQTAFLFSKVELYLEASKILENVDRKKSKDFKNIYAEKMIEEGNKLFSNKTYELAALQYEKAAQWTAINLDDKKITQDSFKLSINSWISACKCEKAFRILDRLPHEEVINILIEITKKIIDSAEYLVSIRNFELANEQLYISIYIYQREGLFEELRKFTDKLISNLLTILDQKIKEKDLLTAQTALYELENIWDSYDIEKINIDEILEKLIKLFLEELNFGMATTLINKLNSIELKHNLTELGSKIEEKEIATKKEEKEEIVQKGVEIVKDFAKNEQIIIAEMNTKQIEEANKQVIQKNYLNGAKIIKNQSVFLKNIGKEEIADQLLTKALDILIEAKFFDDFFKIYTDMTENMKKKYLTRIFPVYLEKLKELKQEKDFEKKERIFEISIKKFRNEILYEKSKENCKLFIKVNKSEALKIIENEEDLNGINKAIDLIKKINIIISAYFEKEEDKVSFDKINKKIAEVYLSLEDYSSALTYTDKIEKIEYKTELSKKIQKFESIKSKVKTKKAKETFKSEKLKEFLSIIMIKGRDAMHDRETELRQRKGLRRAYFKDILDFLVKQDFDEAINSYKESIIQLNRIKKYNLAGVSLAMAGFLLIKEEKLSETINLLNSIKTQLSQSEKLFSETFPVILLDYIIELTKLKDESKLKQSLSYLENLPLFEEEIKIIYKYLGKEYKEKEVEGVLFVSQGEIATKRAEINKLAKKIKTDKQEVAKRKMMKRDYWIKAIKELSNNNYLDASSIYFESYKILGEKKFYDHAAIGLIFGSLILIKARDFLTAKSVYEDKLKLFKSELVDFPVIQFMDYIFLAFEDYIQDLIKLTLNILSEKLKLMLFEPEVEFLKLLSGVKPIVKEDLEKGEIANLQAEINKIAKNIKKERQDIAKRKLMRKDYWNTALEELSKNNFHDASLNYLNAVETLYKKKLTKYAALNLILGSIILIKYKNVEIARNTFEETFNKLWDIKSESEILPEIQIMKYVFLSFESEIQNIIQLTLKNLAEKLILFEPELEFLNSLSGVEKHKKEIEETLTRKERGEISKLKVDLDLIFSNLQQNIGDIRSDSKDFFIKRKAMKKRYYDKILSLLEGKKFEEASKLYFDVAMNYIKRKDFKNGSLLILLSGLAALKGQNSLNQVKNKITEFLESLGMNKTLIEDTYFVKSLLFILDVKMNQMNQYDTNIRNLLKILPLFEEENELIEFEI